MSAHPHTRPERFSGTSWLARTNVVANDPDSWQDVSVRPEGRAEGFTVAIYTHELLEEDFGTLGGCVTGVGPDPETLVAPGSEATLDVPNLAVYVARPFSPAEALFYTEALMVEAGVPISSLEEVDADRFFPLIAGEAAGRD